MSDIAATTLLISLGACFLLLVAHVLLERLLLRRRKNVSPQVALVKLSLVIYSVPILSAAWMYAMDSIGDSREMAFSIIYSLVVYNAFAYTYFHVFNLSETGQRIRFMIDMKFHKNGKGLMTTQAYSPRTIILMRLARLEQMGQIRLGPDKGYRIHGRQLLLVGQFLRRISILLVGKNSTA